MDPRTLKELQHRTAELSIGASTLRNQGAKNVVATARSFLKRIDLSTFRGICREQFFALLDKETKRLKQCFPSGARNWGAARKALNIFLRDVLYNRYLCRAYSFAKLEKWLETPLDSDVATGLIDEPEGTELPRWQSIKNLTPEISNKYQTVALDVARRIGIERVHLDLIYWRRRR